MVGSAPHAVGSAFHVGSATHGRICVPWSDARDLCGFSELRGPWDLWDSCGLRGLLDMGGVVDGRRLGPAAPVGHVGLRRWRNLLVLAGAMCDHYGLWVLCDLWGTCGL